MIILYFVPKENQCPLFFCFFYYFPSSCARFRKTDSHSLSATSNPIHKSIPPLIVGGRMSAVLPHSGVGCFYGFYGFSDFDGCGGRFRSLLCRDAILVFVFLLFYLQFPVQVADLDHHQVFCQIIFDAVLLFRNLLLDDVVI